MVLLQKLRPFFDDPRHGSRPPLLGGSSYLLTKYNCTYDPLISPLSTPNMVISTGISTVIMALRVHVPI